MGDSEYVQCPRCRLCWPTRGLCPACAFCPDGPISCSICHGTGEAGLTPAHECPPPYPREVAEAMVQIAQAAGGVIVSPRQKARIRLGLADG